MYQFSTLTGTVRIDLSACSRCESKVCVGVCRPGILALKEGGPELARPADEVKRGRCVECLACEQECWAHGLGAIRIDLPILGLPVEASR